MTDKQPEALRLAEEGMQIHEYNAPEYKVCAELRRLHEVNAELVEALRDLLGEVTDGYEPHTVFIDQAKAALAKAQGDNNE